MSKEVENIERRLLATESIEDLDKLMSLLPKQGKDEIPNEARVLTEKLGISIGKKGIFSFIFCH